MVPLSPVVQEGNPRKSSTTGSLSLKVKYNLHADIRLGRNQTWT